MKNELFESIETAASLEKANPALEQTPPRLERLGTASNTEKASEIPPKLERASVPFKTESLSSKGNWMSDALKTIPDMDDAEFERMQRKHEYQLQREEARRERLLAHPVNYGTPTTESGWMEEAAKEYLRSGKETTYYQNCMRYAAEAHVRGK